MREAPITIGRQRNLRVLWQTLTHFAILFWQIVSYIEYKFDSMKRLILLITISCISIIAASQKKFYPKVEVIESGVKTSLRGLSVVNDNVVWVSGSNGMVGKTTNGGKNWKWVTVKGFEKADFRDIEAFDANTAIIMAIAEPAYILRTTNGGDSWKLVYENKTKGMFLDAMDFRDPKNGLVIGDPVDGRFFMANTTDAGNSWK